MSNFWGAVHLFSDGLFVPIHLKNAKIIALIYQQKHHEPIIEPSQTLSFRPPA